MEKGKKLSTRSLIFVGMFAAVLAVLSQLSIPMPSGVPITLQTFAVALTAYVLGWKLGTAATVVYVLVGAVGVPVFANFSGGAGVLVGMTGGFIWGFIFMVLLCGLGLVQKNKILLVVLSAAGLAVCHLLGIFQFMAVMGMGFVPAAMAVSVPYLIKDVASVIAAYFVALAIRRALSAANLAYEL
ncbi:MAG: biotin transporter BioY [Eubacteriales bacterium]|nr:biotin transporter BioY [Eubacteriales bacterium]